ncbi:MAG: hypothetical protein ACXWSD_16735, partial [Bdellovibrionota bacterium]
AVSLFSGVVPETTRILSCNCQANTSARANCIWDAQNPWYDPIRTGGAAGAIDILTGEFEAYDGNPYSLTSFAKLNKGSISIAGQTCLPNYSSNPLARGCKLPYALHYTGPTLESGSTPSKAGELKLVIGSGTTRVAQVGLADPRGANNLGLTELSCGFDYGVGGASGGTGGTSFVLNLKLKARSNLVNTTSNSKYESWYPTTDCSNNYCKGSFREVRLKFAMRNLTTRGVYYWKPTSTRNCRPVGATTDQANVALTSAAPCCSHAWNGTSCITCLPAGSAALADASNCCSGNLSGGLCL